MNKEEALYLALLEWYKLYRSYNNMNNIARESAQRMIRDSFKRENTDKRFIKILEDIYPNFFNRSKLPTWL